MIPHDPICEYCDSPGTYRRDADQMLCRECYQDWQYCQRKGKEPSRD